MNSPRYLPTCFVVCLSLAALVPTAAPAQMEDRGVYALPQDQIVPGKPWTHFIPDPDKYQWPTTGGRPGYRFLGMLPLQKRFYDYIQQKRARNQPLTYWEGATIRHLIERRRWPEPPRPNAFWAEFMRQARNFDSLELRTDQTLLMAELIGRGLMPVDRMPTPNLPKVREYLNSGCFQPRTWFERTFGRVEPWMEAMYAGMGFDMRPLTPAGNVFPGEPFNGMQITYNVAGAVVGDPKDSPGFTTGRSLKGNITGSTLTVSGTVRVGGYGADVAVSIWAGSKKDEKKFYVKNEGSSGNPTNFSVSIPVEKGVRSGGFAIRMDGRYSMGGGHRGLYVAGSFSPTASEVAAAQAAADAQWRRKVEETLAALGYQNTPAGKELADMRAALAGGDAAWKAWVDKRQRELGYDPTPEGEEYRKLQTALAAGGKPWDDYVAKGLGGGGTGGGQTAGGGTGGGTAGGGTGGGTPGGGGGYQPPPNVGNMAIGTGVSNGAVENESGAFTAPPKVSCITNFANIPANTQALALWTRDGQEVIRSERTIGGTGWVSFSIMNSAGLTPGQYTVTITAGGKVLSRKSFKVLPK
ncbi:MAG: hypothetical protein KKI08_24125 [Armatimonadetes bacterium]|nr:hypothetical protein [Armatimonadota bacterium]